MSSEPVFADLPRVPCCVCNPRADHNGMPCWKCWCEVRAERKRLREALVAARPFVAAYGLAKPLAARLLARDAAKTIDAALGDANSHAQPEQT